MCSEPARLKYILCEISNYVLCLHYLLPRIVIFPLLVRLTLATAYRTQYLTQYTVPLPVDIAQYTVKGAGAPHTVHGSSHNLIE